MSKNEPDENEIDPDEARAQFVEFDFFDQGPSPDFGQEASPELLYQEFASMKDSSEYPEEFTATYDIQKESDIERLLMALSSKEDFRAPFQIVSTPKDGSKEDEEVVFMLRPEDVQKEAEEFYLIATLWPPDHPEDKFTEKFLLDVSKGVEDDE